MAKFAQLWVISATCRGQRPEFSQPPINQRKILTLRETYRFILIGTWWLGESGEENGIEFELPRINEKKKRKEKKKWSMRVEISFPVWKIESVWFGIFDNFEKKKKKMRIENVSVKNCAFWRSFGIFLNNIKRFPFLWKIKKLKKN